VKSVTSILLVWYTNIMEQLIEKYGWKKVAIVSAIGSIGVIIFAVSSIISVDEKALQRKQELTKMQSGQSGEEQNDGNRSGQGLTTYLSTHVQVSYPQGYEPAEFEPGADNLSNLKLRHNSYEHEISIVTYSYRKKSLQDLVLPYRDFEKVEGGTNSSPVTEYREENGKLEYVQRIAFIEKKDNLVKVTMIYQGSANEIFEEDFEKIVSSIK